MEKGKSRYLECEELRENGKSSGCGSRRLNNAVCDIHGILRGTVIANGGWKNSCWLLLVDEVNSQPLAASGRRINKWLYFEQWSTRKEKLMPKFCISLSSHCDMFTM